MARTIQQIYDAIILEKETFSSLDGLSPSGDNYSTLLSNITSSSKVAFWRLFCYIHAVAIYIHEIYFDKHKQEIENIVATVPTGTPAWYKKKVFDFQYGDPLVFNSEIYQFTYQTIDNLKKIVTKCAIQDSPFGVVLIKVAKGPDGALLPLTTFETLALQSYINDIKFAGSRVSISSVDGDLLNINYDIYYDPLIPIDVLQNSIQTAVEYYLNNTLPFNGTLNLNKLTDAIQAVTGVIDSVVIEVLNTPFAGATIVVDREVLPASGWFKLQNPISSSCNFIALP